MVEPTPVAKRNLTGQQVMDEQMRQARPLLDFKELQRGQRVRVEQDPIEGVVTNPNGPVIRVERADGGSFLYEPLSSARIEPVAEPGDSPDRLRQHFAGQLTCIGDTDGDGNCPLPLCGHCRPGNFTIAQLAELVCQQRVAEALTGRPVKEET